MSEPTADPEGLSVVIPVTERHADLPNQLQSWVNILDGLGRPYELFLIDQTPPQPDTALLPRLTARAGRIEVLSCHDAGLGAALKRAIPRATQPLLCYTTLDYPYRPSDLRTLLDRMSEVVDDTTGRRLDVVNGFRTGRTAPAWVRVPGMCWRTFWNLALDLGLKAPPGWLGLRARAYARLNRFLFGTRLLDINSGFKIVRRAVFDRFPLQSDSAFVHAEILAKTNFLGAYMDELPLSPSPTPIPKLGPIGRDFRTVLSAPLFRTPRSDAMNTVTIDAHQHFWKLDDERFNYTFLDAEPLAPIKRDFLPADLKPLLEEKGIKKCVFVQTQHTIEENRWALKLAKEHDFIAGVVGWVDLASERCEEQLAEFKDNPKFVGVRHIVQDEPDDDWIIRDDVLRGLKVLEKHKMPYDLLFYVKHIHHAATLAKKLPELPMVIDHLSKPEIKAGKTEGWLEHLKAAAKFPNVYCKLSGMITEADWKTWNPADLKPYVQAALEAFGPDRLMFGSDWPVCLLAGSYAQVVEALGEALGEISPDERAMIFGGTATTFYKLDV